MANDILAAKPKWRPTTVGKLVGGAFGFSLAVALSMRAAWIQLLIAFSPIITPIPFLSIFVILVVCGAGLGTVLAKANFVPPLRPITSIAMSILVAASPSAVGFIEVWSRGAPFAFPDNVQVIHRKIEPWGDQLFYLQSSTAVPELHDRLVLAAKQGGWTCEFCQYQPSTGTGHANFRSKDERLGGPGGNLSFEVWPGDMALYETKPSNLAQVRIGYRKRTWGIEYTNIVLLILLAAGMIHYSENRERGV